MKTTKYQIIILGSSPTSLKKIQNAILQKIEEMGMKPDIIDFIESNSFSASYISNAPTFALYFGDEFGHFSDIGIVNRLKDDATLILPIAGDLTKVSTQIPDVLTDINAFEFKSDKDIESLVSVVLEGLSLLRVSRRVFISYKRSQSQSTAIQLYERFEKSGFDVFLDTHSIRPGEPFQDELWHRMADTDVIVMLNTNGFMDSRWTREELGKANSMQIGILQLIWPDHTLERHAQICIPYQLTKADFKNEDFTGENFQFTEQCLDAICRHTESLRARSLGARQDMLTSEFVKFSQDVGVNVTLHPEKFLTCDNKKGEEIIVVPAVGVPQSLTINQCEEIMERLKRNRVKNVFLLYNHINVRDKWVNHLSWLNKHLPVQTIKILEAKSWLTNI